MTSNSTLECSYSSNQPSWLNIQHDILFGSHSYISHQYLKSWTATTLSNKSKFNQRTTYCSKLSRPINTLSWWHHICIRNKQPSVRKPCSCTDSNIIWQRNMVNWRYRCTSKHCSMADRKSCLGTRRETSTRRSILTLLHWLSDPITKISLHRSSNSRRCSRSIHSIVKTIDMSQRWCNWPCWISGSKHRQTIHPLQSWWKQSWSWWIM